jgi:ATPase, P-type (transporting), HAD superfamily, subfamily IC
VGTEERLLGLIAVADLPREESAAVIRVLKGSGVVHTVMLTGDHRRTAEAVARQVGVDEVHAELLPEDKLQRIQALRRRYGTVAMVGDGINDAPALAAATVGVAMGGAGTDAALETADIVLMNDDLTRLPETVRLGRRALRVIRQNIAFSLVTKLVAVALVVPGWLTLWLAILADMGATLLVTANSLRLLRVKGA